MKRIMISNGMRGKADPKAYVDKCRDVVDTYYAAKGEPIERINTYFEDFEPTCAAGSTGYRLEFLGKSISEGLALADEVVFMDDWENYDGCAAEHFIAERYEVPIVYLST